MNTRDWKRTRLTLAALLALVTLLVPAAFANDDEERAEDVEIDESVVFDPHANVRTVIRIDDGDGEPVVRVFGRDFRSTYLGVNVVDLNQNLCEHFGVAAKGAVMIEHVGENTPAERAGLKVGDIISGVSGKPVGSTWELVRLVSGREEGETVLLEVWRDRSVEKIEATLEARKGVSRFPGGEAAFFNRVVPDLSALESLEGLEGLEGLEFLVMPEFEMPDFPMPEVDEDVIERIVEEHQRAIEKAYESNEWIKELQQRESEAQEELQQRMKELEARLKEMEQKLRENQRELQKKD